MVGLGWPQFGDLVSFTWPLTFLQQVGSRSHRAIGMETSKTLIETINLLQHLSFMLEDSLKHLMILGCPFILKCEAKSKAYWKLYIRGQGLLTGGGQCRIIRQ